MKLEMRNPKFKHWTLDFRPWTQKRSCAFTLVELLVTIGIIAILAAILLPAMNAAFSKAESAQAQSEVKSLVTASKAYYSEYGKWPCEENGEDGDYTFHAGGGSATAEWSQKRIIDILRAVDTTNNPRKIVFLEVSDKSMSGTDKDGNVYASNSGFFLDPWGTPYVITFDTDFDNTCEQTPPETGAVGDDIQGQGVCVWSWGPEPGNSNKFVKSWQ